MQINLKLINQDINGSLIVTHYFLHMIAIRKESFNVLCMIFFLTTTTRLIIVGAIQLLSYKSGSSSVFWPQQRLVEEYIFKNINEKSLKILVLIKKTK